MVREIPQKQLRLFVPVDGLVTMNVPAPGKSRDEGKRAFRPAFLFGHDAPEHCHIRSPLTSEIRIHISYWCRMSGGMQQSFRWR